MRAADHLGIRGKLPRSFTTAGDTDGVERSTDFVRPATATASGCRQPFLQDSVGRINAKTDQMYRLAVPSHGNFNAADKFQSKFLRRNLGRRNSTGIVMIGQREYREPALNGSHHQVMRGQCPVGKGRVAVQVWAVQWRASRRHPGAMWQAFVIKRKILPHSTAPMISGALNANLRIAYNRTCGPVGGQTRDKQASMNRQQMIAMAIAAANIVLVMLFPPFDAYALGKTQIPVFAGFYFYPNRTDHMVVNTSLLFLELFVILINSCIAYLLLRAKKVRVTQRRVPWQSATLLVVAVNLVVILLFPPFESVFAMSRASIPTFEGFYFVFARQQNHVIVTAILYIEVFFVLVNGAIFWLIFRDKRDAVPTPEEAIKLMVEMRKRGG
jgi:hypothetical protein